MPVMDALCLRDVTKTYRRGGGIRHLSLAVPPGVVFGFLGPNGAGKTTTIRLMVDLIRPDAGSVEVFGLDARRSSVAVHERIGYLPGELALYDRVTARELLEHFAHLRRGLPWSAVAPLVERLDLDLDRPIRTLSRGNKQKVGLVQAFMGRPELVILDEPTSGLDPLMQHEVHDLIRETQRDGRTVFLSSHVLSEVQRVADRVAVIRDGSLVAVEDVATLHAHAVHTITARFRTSPPSDAFTTVPGVTRAVVVGPVATIDVEGEMDAIIKAISHFDVVELGSAEPDIEQLFLRFYSGDGHG
jgi:ABC-2 type transport system ATP-binding protein